MRAAFWLGLATGICLSLGAAAAGADLVVRRGVHVQVGGAVASQVQQAAEEEARAELPSFLEQLKEQLPAQVERQLDAQLAAPTLAVGNVVLPLPPSLRAPLRAELRQLLVAGFDQGLDAVDTASVAHAFGLRTRETVARAMARVPLEVEAGRGLRVPVYVRLR